METTYNVTNKQGEVIGTRRSVRQYTHAIRVNGDGVLSFHGSKIAAEKARAARSALLARYNAPAEALEVVECAIAKTHGNIIPEADKLARNEKTARTRLEKAADTGAWRRAAALYVRHAVGLSEEDRKTASDEVCALACEVERSEHYAYSGRFAESAKTATANRAHFESSAAYYMEKATRARY